MVYYSEILIYNKTLGRSYVYVCKVIQLLQLVTVVESSATFYFVT